jgi:DNA adenine methylase
MMFLPKEITKVIVPPIKCQGIKTKLIPFIAQNIQWNGKGKWIEPFLGSGVVAFNIQPESAILSDTNRHIIRFYEQIQKQIITDKTVRESLQEMGSRLQKKGDDYYYEVRERFNDQHDSIDFLFLNRSCFNGLMRFNSKGGFNVPFGHKPERFAKSYITKIVNQVKNLSNIMKDKDWKFIVSDWRESLALAKKNDFVYMDPPYVGRHTDYFNTWSDMDAIELSEIAASLPCQYALSMWLENRYRKNDHIEEHWFNTNIKTASHFYHVGSTESLRNAMTEALVLKPFIQEAV